MRPGTGERAAAVEQRAAAAVAAMKGSIEREDLHQMETFSQLKTIRALLQAHTRWEAQPSSAGQRHPAIGMLDLPERWQQWALGCLGLSRWQAAHLHHTVACAGAKLLRWRNCCWSFPSCHWSRLACACARCRRNSCTLLCWPACPE